MSEHFRVRGGARLTGEVQVVGAKNSVLKLMAAALLAEGTTTLTNCPQILDVPLMADVLRGLGCDVEIDHIAVDATGSRVRITTPAELKYEADYGS
ncbi:MAG: UDP-N-acetylglucosamine 1-carboxyvinyltransferase, partial [Pseudonocardiaceae bacterium]